METKKIYTVKEVAEMVGKSPDWVRKLLRSGVLPGEKARPKNGPVHGNHNPQWVVTRDDLLGYLNRCWAVSVFDHVSDLRETLLAAYHTLGGICESLHSMTRDEKRPEVHAILALIEQSDISFDTVRDFEFDTQAQLDIARQALLQINSNSKTALEGLSLPDDQLDYYEM